MWLKYCTYIYIYIYGFYDIIRESSCDIVERVNEVEWKFPSNHEWYPINRIEDRLDPINRSKKRVRVLPRILPTRAVRRIRFVIQESWRRGGRAGGRAAEGGRGESGRGGGRRNRVRRAKDGKRCLLMVTSSPLRRAIRKRKKEKRKKRRSYPAPSLNFQFHAYHPCAVDSSSYTSSTLSNTISSRFSRYIYFIKLE